MKKTLLLLGLSLLTVATASAADFSAENSDGVTIYYDINGDESSVTVTFQEFGVPCYTGEVFVPDMVNDNGIDYPVTAIGSNAFYNCTSLTSVNLPMGVTSIGMFAFYGCSSLIYVGIGSDLTEIGMDAFHGCSSLTSLYLPDSVSRIGHNTFWGCSSLVSISLPESLTLIPGCLFYECTSLDYVSIPSSVKEIGYRAFYQCEKLASINIPDAVTTIGSDAFFGTALYDNSSKWSDGVLYIGKHLIQANSSMTSRAYTVKDGTIAIAKSAFSGKNELTVVNLPSSLVAIGESAFADCTGLCSVDLPQSLITIGYEAFAGCTGLLSVTIPDTVLSIGAGAFKNTALYADETKWENDVLYIDNHLIAARKQLTGHYEVRDNVVSVANAAFSSCTGLTSVSFPITTIAMGKTTFSGCISLTSVALPELIDAIESSVFEDCASLTSINIPGNVTKIGDSAFYGCKGLTSLTLPESLTTINSNAFYNCISLSTLEIPESVTVIEDLAFGHCDGLKSARIPKSVVSLGSYAFGWCKSLQSLYAENVQPENIKLGESVFYNAPYDTCILYVPLGSSALYAAAPQWREFNVIKEHDPSSSIDDIDAGTKIADSIYFDLMGRRVDNPTHGIYIRDGHKILMK